MQHKPRRLASFYYYKSLTCIVCETNIKKNITESNKNNVYQILYIQVAGDMQPCDYRPLYACSRHWTDFAFGLPSSSDTTAYWLNVLPRCTHRCMGPLLMVLSARMPLATCINCLSSGCSRARMRLWPPAVLDTAHGFKLIRH